MLELDDRGLPFRASTNRLSPYYFPATGMLLRFNGRAFADGKVIAYDRREGWIRVRPWEGGEPYYLQGQVEVFRMPQQVRSV